MRWLHQLTAFVIFNRKPTTNITGKSLISNTENQFMQTTTRACFMFSHFISTELKPLQTFPAVSSCPTGDLECALRCLESFGDKGSWVEKRALAHTGRRDFLAAPGSVVCSAQCIHRCDTGLMDTFFWAYFLKLICICWPLEELYWSLSSIS